VTGTARVRLHADAGDDDGLAVIYDRVLNSVASIPAMYQALANAPEVLNGWIGLGWRLRADSEAGRGLRELAILRVAQLTTSEYVWRSHFRPAVRAGFEETTLLTALADWRAATIFGADERAVLALADELTGSTTVTEPTWAAVADLFDDRAAVELVMTIAWYCCVAKVAGALVVPLDDQHTSVPPLPRSG
jgi:alkylhydroperoxidase family enzyme